MGEGRAHTNRRLRQIVEPTDNEKAAVKAARTFGRVFAHDSAALGVAAFALFFFIVFAIVIVTLVGGIASGEYGQQDITWLAAIGAFLFVVFALLVVAAVLVARHHYLHPDKIDVFATDGRLFHTWFLRDKEYKDGRGIVRINVVGIAECTGFHNRKDRTVWILPGPDARIYDVWRRGKRWEDERDLCLDLLEKGIPNGSDTDPFYGVDEQYRGFLERIGVRVEETTEPVTFLAGTWSLVDDYLHD